ncbi:hypothetical protein GCM10009798_14180 [Nocardioides panacihumi]|uniref:DUF4145 domain-containing protein n=1 Tax=Nocardioides panacihumi TaxID=400774 RepID=A0ABN2QQ21_9ACTN
MEARSTLTHIHLGALLRFLVSQSKGWEVFGDDRLVGNIRSLVRRLDQVGFPVSARLSKSIEEIADRFDAEAKAWQKANRGADLAAWKARRVLTAAEAREVSRLASNLEDAVWAEAEVQVAFITREKRYDVNRLLSNVGSLMASGVYDGLPVISQGDFAAAGRCIAFELPTAAAFHLMRGTEDALRDFYRRIVKRERVDPPLWYQMTEHLRKRRDTPPEALMNNLDNIRRSFRNPTQHPEKVYDIDEAQDLMSLSIDVVTRMQRHLESVGR